jgi:translation initiation factor IF-2
MSKCHKPPGSSGKTTDHESAGTGTPSSGSMHGLQGTMGNSMLATLAESGCDEEVDGLLLGEEEARNPVDQLPPPIAAADPAGSGAGEPASEAGLADADSAPAAPVEAVPAAAPAQTVDLEALDAEFKRVWKTTGRAETDAWLDALPSRDPTEVHAAKAAEYVAWVTEQRAAADARRADAEAAASAEAEGAAGEPAALLGAAAETEAGATEPQADAVAPGPSAEARPTPRVGRSRTWLASRWRRSVPCSTRLAPSRTGGRATRTSSRRPRWRPRPRRGPPPIRPRRRPIRAWMNARGCSRAARRTTWTRRSSSPS